MVHSTVPLVKEKIARKGILCRNFIPDLCLFIGTSRKFNTELPIDEHSKSGTVTAIGERFTAPYIRISKELHRVVDQFLTIGRCGFVFYDR